MNNLAAQFAEVLDQSQILDEDTDLIAYGSDSSKDFKGKASIVLLPRTTEEVANIIQICRKEHLGVIPSGGRTGLCGGATALAGEVVLSLEKMNAIQEINPLERTTRVQAGVTTQQLKDALAEEELDFPISLASQGSSQIGGNIATNAGGIHFIRYGSTGNWVLGLTVVTGTGEIIRTGKALCKDNTGYDLRGLFIGAEGTLGVVTEAILSTTELPKDLTRILCAVDSLEKTMNLLHDARKQFPLLRAFEFFTDEALSKVLNHHDLREPFEGRSPCYVLLELEGTPESREAELGTFFVPLIEKGLLADVIISQSSKQAEELLSYRELISDTLNSHYTPHKNDISVPVSQLPAFLERFKELMNREAPGFEVIIFGHAGDGNLHLNLLKPSGMDDEEFFTKSHEIDKMTLKIVSDFRGSISAEHGIGLLKKDALHLSRSQEEIDAMRQIKKIFDPDGIMNPGKIFD